MKKPTSMQEALAFQLQGLYYAETRIQEELPSCSRRVQAKGLAEEISKYVESSADKRLKLERVFNYLMVEMMSRESEAIDKMMEEMHRTLASTDSGHLKDILMIGCMQSMNAYKTAAYRSAYRFAVELELDVAVDLLQQIIEWEVKTESVLAALAIAEFNHVQKTFKQ